ncbi:MAG: GNAT family N-acetyltransferase [Verrucomicrobia bacterium]|nr:GNAT family N-acetyltransferase [Verrucomicrobiota bacterium]
MFSIRPATPADSGAIAALYSTAGYPASAPAMQTRLGRVITDPAHAVLVAELTGSREVVGAVHVSLYPILDSDDAAQVLGVVVAEKHQRNGIGGALLERAERWARERHCTTVFLRTHVLRTDAQSFYARLGYLNDRTQFTFQKKLPH